MQKWLDTFQRILFTGASITVLAIALNHATSPKPVVVTEAPRQTVTEPKPEHIDPSKQLVDRLGGYYPFRQ